MHSKARLTYTEVWNAVGENDAGSDRATSAR